MEQTRKKPNSYILARQALIKVVQSVSGANAQTYINNVKLSANKIVGRLGYNVVREISDAINAGYGDCKSTINRNINAILRGKNADETFTEKVNRIYKNIDSELNKSVRNNKLYTNGYVQLGDMIQGLKSGVSEQINEVLKTAKADGKDTVEDVRRLLVDTIKKDGPKININGRNYSAEGYATMLGRTARMETANKTMFEYVDNDLVICIGQDVTCAICAQYRNKVYSISGKDKRFTPLRGGKNSKSPLGNTYDTIHPNCRCEFIPWFEGLHTDEIDKVSRRSLAPLKDQRSEKQRDEYEAWQDKNRQLYTEEKEYFAMKEVFGKDMPYSTLGGFRRAKRGNTLGYKKTVQSYKRRKTI